jgi:hypothetical protein
MLPQAHSRAALRARAPAPAPRSLRGGRARVLPLHHRSRATTVARASFWRSLPDGERVGERELRLKEAAAREARLLRDNGEPLLEHVRLVERAHTHALGKGVLTGVDNEPPPHHHEARRASACVHVHACVTARVR